MKKPTKKQAKQLATLRKMKDRGIDLSDIPEITDWSNAVVGKFNCSDNGITRSED
jgi:hypothetical protein